jgi:hypothetical protein
MWIGSEVQGAGINRMPTGRRHDPGVSNAPHPRQGGLLPGHGMNEVSYRARYLLNAYPPVYMGVGRWRHRGQGGYVVTRDTELVMEGFGRSGNTFAWLAFRSAQPRPVRLAPTPMRPRR